MTSYVRTFMIISCVITLKWIMFQTHFVEKIKINIICSNFFPVNRAVYETWKNMADPDRPQMKIWRMRFAGWIPNATHTHTHTHTQTHTYTHTHTHTHITCNNYCFTTARMIALTRRNITLYVHCLSCISNTGWWTKSKEWKILPTMYCTIVRTPYISVLV